MLLGLIELPAVKGMGTCMEPVITEFQILNTYHGTPLPRHATRGYLTTYTFLESMFDA